MPYYMGACTDFIVFVYIFRVHNSATDIQVNIWFYIRPFSKTEKNLKKKSRIIYTFAVY